MIELSSVSTKAFETYFSTSLKVSISESLGEVKVTDKDGKCLNKVYVKCFARLKNQNVEFYRDGYTDLRGKFNYISLNSETLKDVEKFSLFVMDDNLGSSINESNPPPNLASSDDNLNNATSSVQDYANYRQIVKSRWRQMNKK
jgi:hypothetical protein